MKLEHLLGRTSYIETPQAIIPVYFLTEKDVVFFDSGTEPSDELLELLEQEQLRVRAVVCTHLHPDHIANNDALVQRYGTEIFSHPMEIPALHTRQAVSYFVTPIQSETELIIDGARIHLIPTPGHTTGHLVCVTPDGVCCLGDAMMSKSVLDRARMPYMENVDRSIISMESIRETDYPYYIAAHKGVATRAEFLTLLDENIQKELDLYDLLRQKITGPVDIEDLTSEFIRASGVRSEKMVVQDYVRLTAKVRIYALVHAGEYSLKGNLVVPV